MLLYGLHTCIHMCMHAEVYICKNKQTQSRGKSKLHREYLDVGLFSFKTGAVFELIIYGKISFEKQRASCLLCFFSVFLVEYANILCTVSRIFPFIRGHP